MFICFSTVQAAELAAREQIGDTQLHRGGIRISERAAAIEGAERPGERSQQDPQQCQGRQVLSRAVQLDGHRHRGPRSTLHQDARLRRMQGALSLAAETAYPGIKAVQGGYWLK